MAGSRQTQRFAMILKAGKKSDGVLANEGRNFKESAQELNQRILVLTDSCRSQLQSHGGLTVFRKSGTIAENSPSKTRMEFGTATCSICALMAWQKK